MDFFEVMRKRHSVRAFAGTPVEPDKLQAILEAANQAPSGGNLQAYEIYLARRERDRLALARAALQQAFVAEAPIVLVFCAHPAGSAATYGQRGIRLFALQDATIACAFAMLAATALGLATVWVGAFDDAAVAGAIGAPQGVLPVAILPLGYPAEEPGPTTRRQLQELVHEV